MFANLRKDIIGGILFICLFWFYKKKKSINFLSNRKMTFILAAFFSFSILFLTEHFLDFLKFITMSTSIDQNEIANLFRLVVRRIKGRRERC